MITLRHQGASKILGCSTAAVRLPWQQTANAQRPCCYHSCKTWSPPWRGDACACAWPARAPEHPPRARVCWGAGCRSAALSLAVTAPWPRSYYVGQGARVCCGAGCRSASSALAPVQSCGQGTGESGVRGSGITRGAPGFVGPHQGESYGWSQALHGTAARLSGREPHPNRRGAKADRDRESCGLADGDAHALYPQVQRKAPGCWRELVCC